MPKPEKHILVCTQGRPAGHPRGSCAEKGSGEVFEAFLKVFEAKNLWGRFMLTNTGCMGPCHEGTTVLVYPDGVMYGGVTASDVTEIVDGHIVGGTPVDRLKMPEDVWS